MTAQGGAASGKHATVGRPAVPATLGKGWGGSAPAQRNNLSLVYHSFPVHVPRPYEFTPVDYEPYSPTSWEGNDDAGANEGWKRPASGVIYPTLTQSGGENGAGSLSAPGSAQCA